MERALGAGSDSLDAVRSGRGSGSLLKVALVVGGAAALTAGSAAISSLRRRMGAHS